jgi:hypothetical protein
VTDPLTPAAALDAITLGLLTAVHEGLDPAPMIDTGQQFVKALEQRLGALPIGAQRAAYARAGSRFLLAWSLAEPDRADDLVAASEQLEAAAIINLVTLKDDA